MNISTVELLLENKRPVSGIVSVKPSDSVLKAAEVLKTQDVGLLIVLDKNKLVGVVSERDIVRRWVVSANFPNDVLVSEIMSKDVESVSVLENIKDCYLRFVARNCRHLPVLDPLGNVVGVLSLRDVSDYVVNHL